MVSRIHCDVFRALAYHFGVKIQKCIFGQKRSLVAMHIMILINDLI